MPVSCSGKAVLLVGQFSSSSIQGLQLLRTLSFCCPQFVGIPKISLEASVSPAKKWKGQEKLYIETLLWTRLERNPFHWLGLSYMAYLIARVTGKCSPAMSLDKIINNQKIRSMDTVKLPINCQLKLPSLKENLKNDTC